MTSKRVYLDYLKDIADAAEKMLVHDYFGVNLEVVWKTALEDVPNLGLQMQRILTEFQR